MAHVTEKSIKMLRNVEQSLAALKLYEGNYQASEELLTKLRMLSGKIEILDSWRLKNKAKINELSVLTLKTAQLEKKVNACELHQIHLSKSIPDAPSTGNSSLLTIVSSNSDVFNYFASSSLNINQLNGTGSSSLVSPIPESWKYLTSPALFDNQVRCSIFDKVQLKLNTNRPAEKPKEDAVAVPRKPPIPSVALFTESELKLVPGYLKGRLECSQINAVIDTINSVLEMKYTLMRKKYSQVKNSDKPIYIEWKNQEKLSVRGQYSFTQQDLITHGHHQMCKRTMNIFNILHHVKRLKKEHMKNNTKFILITN